MRMTRIFPTVVLLAIGLLFMSATDVMADASADADDPDDPQVIGVLLYADWCGSCQVLEPKLDEVKSEFSGAPILFTQFDKTDDFTTEQSRLYASWTGLDALFDEHEGSTGYMVLIDAETHEELARLTRDQTEEELRETIAGVLNR